MKFSGIFFIIKCYSTEFFNLKCSLTHTIQLYNIKKQKESLNKIIFR